MNQKNPLAECLMPDIGELKAENARLHAQVLDAERCACQALADRDVYRDALTALEDRIKRGAHISIQAVADSWRTQNMALAQENQTLRDRNKRLTTKLAKQKAAISVQIAKSNLKSAQAKLTKLRKS